MQSRLNLSEIAPGAARAMLGLENYIAQCKLDRTLIKLVKLRASQINGCAFCIDMHSKDARAAGETEQRLYCLDAWREAPFYSDRERAALAWAEELTLVHERHVPDTVFEQVQRQFTDQEIADLTLVVATINAWNRFAISLRAIPGAYEPAREHAMA